MPVWWVSEPYINVWVADEPAAYTTTLGEQIVFRINYKQRPVRSTEHKFVPFPMGAGWSHSWFSYVHVRDTAGTTTFSSYDAVVSAADGGEYHFPSGTLTDPGTGLNLTPMDGDSTDICPTNSGYPNIYGKVGFRLVHPDGSQDLYGQVTAAYDEEIIGAMQTNHAWACDALLTDRIDAFGNTTKFYYTNSVGSWLLKYVVDYDQRTNTLVYTNVAGQMLLAAVNMPYGRSAKMLYDSVNGYLLKVTDAQTNETTFGYNQYLTTMLTPYGQTIFAHRNDDGNVIGFMDIGNAGGTNRINRSVLITLPDGSQELYAYMFNTGSNGVPASMPARQPPRWELWTTEPARNFLAPTSTRNSFHWNAKQLAGVRSATGHTNILDFAPADYAFATVKHWLVQTNREGFIDNLPSPAVIN
jgi:hypothetical protein